MAWLIARTLGRPISELQLAVRELAAGDAHARVLLDPGAEQVAALGGLHRFMNWPKPILTDSGGFQAYSVVRENLLRQGLVSGKQESAGVAAGIRGALKL